MTLISDTLQFHQHTYQGNSLHDSMQRDEGLDYTKTPGIDIGKESVEGVGQFTVWDCAGQLEYSVTHGMFLGSVQSIFLVIYNLLDLLAGDLVIIVRRGVRF